MATDPKIEKEKLAIKREALAGELNEIEMKALFATLNGGNSVYREQVDMNTKEKVARIKAIADYHKAVQGGSAAAKIRALADLAKTVFTTPERLAKLTSAATPAVLDAISNGTGFAFGDDPSDSKTKAGEAWQIFLAKASTINGAALMATYDRVAEQYGAPQNSHLNQDDGLIRQMRNIQQKVNAQRNLMENAHERLLTLTDNVDSGDEEAALQGYAEIASILPGITTPDAIRNMQKAVEAEPVSAALTDPGLIKEEQMALDRLKAMRQGPVEPEKDTETNFYAHWLKSERIQAWAKFHGFRVGKVYDLTEENKKRLAEGKIPDGIVTPNGIYVPGPDDNRARVYGKRELAMKPEEGLFQAFGIGNPRERTKEFVEFDIAGTPDMKQHPDGAWYFAETEGGGRTYLTREDLAARRAASPTSSAAPSVEAVGKTADGGTLWALSDGRYAYLGKGADGKNPAVLPDAAAQKLLAGVTLKPAGGKVPLPEGISGKPDPDALPTDVKKTTTPPQGARETVRLRRTVTLNGKSGSVEGFDERGRYVQYGKDQVLGQVRSVLGGNEKFDLESRARALADRKGFKAGKDDLDENQEVAGKKPTAAQKRERAETADTMRETVGHDLTTDRAKPDPEEKPIVGLDKYAAKPPTQSDNFLADIRADLAKKDAQGRKTPFASPQIAPPTAATPGTNKPEDFLTSGSGPANGTPVPKAKVNTGGGAQIEGDKATPYAEIADEEKGMIARMRKKYPTTGDVTSTGTNVETPTRSR